jgi:hypothetical protein
MPDKLKMRKVESWFTKEWATVHFTVELKHWYIDYGPEFKLSFPHPEREHKWNIYVHVYKKHPMFAQLDVEKPYYDQDIICDIPLHHGCTFLELEYEGCIKIGCDYSHYMDEAYGALEEPDQVLADDVQVLYDYMINYKVTPTAISEGTVNTGDSDGTKDS